MKLLGLLSLILPTSASASDSFQLQRDGRSYTCHENGEDRDDSTYFCRCEYDGRYNLRYYRVERSTGKETYIRDLASGFHQYDCDEAMKTNVLCRNSH